MAITGVHAQQLREVRFLTVAEVAAVMRVSSMTVYRLAHTGELKAVRVGRSFRIPEQALSEYLAWPGDQPGQQHRTEAR